MNISKLVILSFFLGLFLNTRAHALSSSCSHLPQAPVARALFVSQNLRAGKPLSCLNNKDYMEIKNNSETEAISCCTSDGFIEWFSCVGLSRYSCFVTNPCYWQC